MKKHRLTNKTTSAFRGKTSSHIYMNTTRYTVDVCTLSRSDILSQRWTTCRTEITVLSISSEAAGKNIDFRLKFSIYPRVFGGPHVEDSFQRVFKQPTWK